MRSACAGNGLVGSCSHEVVAVGEMLVLIIQPVLRWEDRLGVDLLSKVVIVGVHVSRAGDVPARRKSDLGLRGL